MPIPWPGEGRMTLDVPGSNCSHSVRSRTRRAPDRANQPERRTCREGGRRGVEGGTEPQILRPANVGQPAGQRGVRRLQGDQILPEDAQDIRSNGRHRSAPALSRFSRPCTNS